MGADEGAGKDAHRRWVGGELVRRYVLPFSIYPGGQEMKDTLQYYKPAHRLYHYLLIHSG